MDSFDRLREALADRYDIESELGQGGMATVYLARDKRHERQVAVKVIRPDVSAIIGADRFLQEIKLTANLQHPHILPLYDSGSAAGVLYYVMPYVTGESLRVRLERQRLLPVEDSIAITRALASALDYAHRQGVVHRDIKPENILLQDTHPLLADFGIALALTAAAGSRLTQTGLSLGTPDYMSPEQAAGEKHIDGRTDIYALGCVAYEMLAGAPPHTGPTAQAVIAALMTEEPRPLRSIRRTVPIHVAMAVHRALEKTPADRFSTGAQFAAALADAGYAAPAREHMVRRWVPAALLLALSLGTGFGLGAAIVRRSGTPATMTRRWDLVLPETAPVALSGPGPLGLWQSALTLSPDGALLAYASPQEGTTRLAVRRLSSDTVAVLPGTDGAYYPFFSPDGQSIGFFSGSELRSVSVTGGPPATLRRVDRPVGAAWVSKDSILVMESEGFRMRWVRIGGAGSDSTVVLSTQFGNPDVLPGGTWVLGQLSSGQLALLSLRDGREVAITRRGVLPMDQVKPEDLLMGASPRWVETGHLIFGAEDGVLTALPFDARRTQVLGQPVPLIAGVRIEEGFGYAEYALTREGTLVFVPGANQNYGRIVRINRTGTFDTLPFPRGQYTQLRMSPDGQMLAIQRRGPLVSGEVVLLDMATGRQRRLPVEGNYRTFPASWSPDGHSLLVGLWDPVRFLNFGARFYTVDGVPQTEVTLPGASYWTIAPNGKEFVYSDWRTGALYIRRFQGDTSRTAIPGRGFAASFSPDGRWLAYGSTDGGIDVSPVPPTGAIYQVAERGQQPLWTPDGSRIIYRDGRGFSEAMRTRAVGFRTGPPHLVAEGPFVRTFAWNHTIAPDGRLLAVVALPERSARALAVVTGFDAELKRLAPPR